MMRSAHMLAFAAAVLATGFALGYSGAQAAQADRMDRPMQVIFALAVCGVCVLAAKQVAKWV
jgi:hypothetical protein